MSRSESACLPAADGYAYCTFPIGFHAIKAALRNPVKNLRTNRFNENGIFIHRNKIKHFKKLRYAQEKPVNFILYSNLLVTLNNMIPMKTIYPYLAILAIVFSLSCTEKRNDSETKLVGSSISESDKESLVTEKEEKYCDVGDAAIFYEVYGEGNAIVLLHGGLYGSIEEFKDMIPKLAERFKVIAISTRGHGKSELGRRELSFQLFAGDAISVLRNEKEESATVMGFSDGAITAYVMAAEYPETVKKVVALAGAFSFSGFRAGGKEWVENFRPDSFNKNNASFVEGRKGISPEPERWDHFLSGLKKAWTGPEYLSLEKASGIKAPVLSIAGDRDDFTSLEHYFLIHSTIPDSHLSIIPNAGHVDIMKNPMVFEVFINPFL